MCLIINVEGTDGCGKYTQSKLLKEKLMLLGYDVMLHSFPSYDSPSSAPAKMYLNGTFGENTDCLDAYQASTLFAVDRLCMHNILKSKLKDNSILILDRYTPSNLIHQASKIEDVKARNKYKKWLVDFEYNILKLQKPDLVLFLDMPPYKSISLTRSRANLKGGIYNDIHESNTDYMIKSYNVGKEIALDSKWNIVNCVDKFDKIKDANIIHEEIMSVVLKKIK